MLCPFNCCWLCFTGSGNNDSVDEDRVHHGSATLPGGYSLTSSSGGIGVGTRFSASNDEGSECSSITSESNSGAAAHLHSHTKSSSVHSSQGINVVGDCGVPTVFASSSTMPQENLEQLFPKLQIWRKEVDRLRNKLEVVKVCFMHHYDLFE